MNKITLIQHEHTSFNSWYLKPLLTKYFNLVEYDPNVTYDKDTSLAIVGTYNKEAVWAKKLINSGVKVLVDHLWEKVSTDTNRPFPHMLLHNNNWFWYNESLWYQALGYHNYTPNKTYSKLAFMPMRMQRYSRDQLLDSLHPYLDNMIYSYVEKRIYLPNDTAPDLSTDAIGNYCHNYNNPNTQFQRNFNPEWYNNTYFSIVAESQADNATGIFVTEKTFKPLAFWHPFIVYGQPGVLAFLKNLGFETFENLFNESYDQAPDIYHKLPMIKKCVEDFVQVPYDQITWEKLEHNRNLFFNNNVVEQRFVNEIVNQIIEYAET